MKGENIMTRNLTCIVCPLGCNMIVSTDGDTITVTGNTCPRGAEYAKTEMTNPMRSVTSTICCDDGTVVSVKTDRPIPKENIMECMKIINKCNPCLPISVGDVIIKDVFGANIVATSNAKR